MSVGGVSSTLMSLTVVVAELPATSTAVPVTDWFAPSVSVDRRGAAADRDARTGVGARERHRHVGVVPTGAVRGRRLRADDAGRDRVDPDRRPTSSAVLPARSVDRARDRRRCLRPTPIWSAGHAPAAMPGRRVGAREVHRDRPCCSSRRRSARARPTRVIVGGGLVDVDAAHRRVGRCCPAMSVAVPLADWLGAVGRQRVRRRARRDARERVGARPRRR